MKNILTKIGAVLGLVSMLLVASPAFAYDTSYFFTVNTDTTSGVQEEVQAPQTIPNTSNLFSISGTDNTISTIGLPSYFVNTGTQLTLHNVPAFKIVDDNGSFLNDDINYFFSSLAAATSTLAGLSGATSFSPNTFFGSASTTAFVASSTPGLMSAAQSSKLGALGTSTLQSTVLTTDGSGNATWTFATSFGVAPRVVAIAEDATAGALSNVQITSKSATSVTIHAMKVTSALGILSLAANTSLVVDLIAISQ